MCVFKNVIVSAGVNGLGGKFEFTYVGKNYEKKTAFFVNRSGATSLAIDVQYVQYLL